MKLGYWIRHPQQIGSKLRYTLWEIMNPNKPWLSPGTVRYCQAHLSPPMRGLEFGSGKSTPWFAGLLGHLTSIEHSQEWYLQLQDKLARRKIGNVDYRFIPLDHPENEPERTDYDPLPAYVSVLDTFEDECLDLVIVDGHYRRHCILASLAKLKPGGLLLVDDVHYWGEAKHVPVPINWTLRDFSSCGFKSGGVWQKPLSHS
jgi:SAM-dependent methyltransferase